MFIRSGSLLLVVVALAMALAACEGESSGDSATPPTIPTVAPTPTADETIDLTGLVITMRRGPCLGFCPSYSITIREDGSVEYDGSGWVEVEGIHSGEIDTDDVRRLVQRFEDIGFFDIPEDSDCSTTDIPRMTTSVSLGGRVHSVLRCAELDGTGPIGELRAIEQEIDRLTMSEQWIGLDSVLVVLERGRYPEIPNEGCDGPCPDYQMTIRGDGRVTYTGFQNVEVVGTQTGEISQEDVRDLFYRAEEIGFFDLPSDFHCQIRDVGATTTIVGSYRGGNVIERCHVDDPSGRLDRLIELENLIEEVTNSQRWVGDDYGG